MKPKFIFDLSEVLIMGLYGIEKPLSPILKKPENEILSCFGGELLKSICRGEISEDVYLQTIIETQKWGVKPDTLKKIIRENFHREVPGTIDILNQLAENHQVILLSDHAKEWVEYIKGIHSFFDIFDKVFFSYEVGGIKREQDTFRKVLKQMNVQAQDCWLIDDSVLNIRVAAGVGVNGIQFENAEQLKMALTENGLW